MTDNKECKLTLNQDGNPMLQSIECAKCGKIYDLWGSNSAQDKGAFCSSTCEALFGS